MRFLLGIGLGLGIGLAGAMLFAPEKKKQPDWPPHMAGATPSMSGNHNSSGGLKGFMDSVKERLNEALDEAKKARQETEREMMDRYERAIGRKK